MRTKIFTLFAMACLLCVNAFAQQALHHPTLKELKAGNESDNSVSQGVSKTESRPSRLTDIPDDVSPIMVVATIAFKPEVGSGESSQGDFSKEFGEMMEAMKRAKGFMGVRLLRSSDRTPMFVVISWWKDRRSLVDWHYNPAHQKMVNFFYSGSGDSSKPVKDRIAHVGLQFYSLLRDGTALGEKFGPTQKPVEQ